MQAINLLVALITQTSTPRQSLPVGIFSPYINILDFGANGDDEGDDTTAIQSAINFAQSSGLSLYLPAGIYRTSTSLISNRPISISGASSTTGTYEDLSAAEIGEKWKAPHSQIRRTSIANNDECVLKISSYCSVDHIMFVSNPLASSTQVIKYTDAHMPAGLIATRYGLQVNGTGCRITNCAATQATESGFYTQNGSTNEFHNCMASKNRIGFQIRTSDSIISACYAHHNIDSGISLGKGNYPRVINTRVEWNAKYGLIATSGEMQISSSTFDRNGWAGLFLTGGWGATVIGNYFSRNGAGGNSVNGRWSFSKPGTPSYLNTPSNESCHIKVHYQRDVAIVGNRFRAGSDDSGQGSFAPAHVYYNAGANDSIVVSGNAGEQAYKGGFGGFNPYYLGGGSLYFPRRF